MENFKQTVIYTLINLLLVGAVVFLLRRPEPGAMEIVTPPSTPTPPPLRVYVSGAVLNPDVYSLPPGSIVKDALMAAGGPSSEADLDNINLAMPLKDGMHVIIPRKGEALPTAAPVAPSRSTPSLININTASQAELESLPGIGPALARRIIEFRETHGPFSSIEELKKVPGIGEAIFSRIKDYITVR